MEEVERVVLVGEDDELAGVALKYGMELADIPVPGKIDLPFTHDETLELVRRVAGAYPIRDVSLMVVDHRNLLLTENDLRQAIAVHGKHQGVMVISVAPCRDHPCQYRAYFTFLGCEIIRFQTEMDHTSGSSELEQEVLIKSLEADFEDITIHIRGEVAKPCISFHFETPPQHGIVAQVLPFTVDKPLYDESSELFIQGLNIEFQLVTQTDVHLAGVVIVLLVISQIGTYNTIEHFTPQQGDWSFNDFGCAKFDKGTYTLLQGRQQFTPVYTYDGSVCIMNAFHVNKKMANNVKLFVIEESCFVVDSIDYLEIFNVL